MDNGRERSAASRSISKSSSSSSITYEQRPQAPKISVTGASPVREGRHSKLRFAVSPETSPPPPARKSNLASKKVSIISRKSSTESEAESTSHSDAPESTDSTGDTFNGRHSKVTVNPSGSRGRQDEPRGSTDQQLDHQQHAGLLKVPSLQSLKNFLHLHGHERKQSTPEEAAAKRKYSQRVIRFSTAVPPPSGALAQKDFGQEVRRKQSAIVAPPEIVVKQRSWIWRKCFFWAGKKSQTKKDEHLTHLKRDLVIDDHELSIEQLKAHYKIADLERGLSHEDAAERLARDGPNILTPPPQKPEWQKFMHEMLGGFAILVWAGAGLSFLAYGIQVGQDPNADKDNMWLGIVLVLVNLFSGCLSYYQISKSEKIMDSFKKLMPAKALVIRDGGKHEIEASKVVLGDVCEVKFGDRIPADLRVIEAHSMKVDNAALTGESEPQARSPECTSKNPLETKNLAFFSTNCLEGTGRGVVCGIGDNTVMGRIASLTAGLEAGQTSLARELNLVVLILAIMGVSFGVVFFIVSGLVGHPWVDSLVYFVGIICGNVPLGLVASISISLALAAKRMAAKQCLIKNLELVETLGSCSTICSDKTGTLTQNRMTVAHLYYDNQIVEADTSEHQVHNDQIINQYMTSETFTNLWRCAGICNRATFKEGQADVSLMKRECNGDASESALLKFTELVVGNIVERRNKEFKKVCEVPFNSTNKYQVSIHEQPNRPNYLLVMKGAPERIISRCTSIMINNQVLPLDAARRNDFQDAYLELGGLGERVLGFCEMELPASQYPRNYPFSPEDVNFPVEGLTFLGLISLIDPPRATVPDAVRRCKEAGIRVVMVTGDHPITAAAIARSVGIISPGSKTIEQLAEERGCDKSLIDPREATACVLHGDLLKDIEADELDSIIMHYKDLVFARTSPQQKLIIVEAFQRCGSRVAVTGDGVNDSPALKQANIGIAMGITGSDVSKQAADMILLDDNFASIVTGIEEGRTVFDNIKKNVVYNMTKGFPELLPFLLFIVANIPLPISTITIIFIDMGSDMLPSISFSYEAAESDVMRRKPRSPDERMVTCAVLQRAYLQFGILETAGAMFTYFVVYAESGFWPRKLFGLQAEWDNKAVNNLEDSYGQQWTYRQRKDLEYTVYTAYFCTVIIVQAANAIACKTRRMSLFEKGLDNRVMNLALCFGIAFGCFFSYVPIFTAVRMYPIRFVWWLPGIPYAIAIIGWNEMRQYMFRYWPGCWMDRNMYY